MDFTDVGDLTNVWLPIQSFLKSFLKIYTTNETKYTHKSPIN
jgi:hypothetical protein